MFIDRNIHVVKLSVLNFEIEDCNELAIRVELAILFVENTVDFPAHVDWLCVQVALHKVLAGEHRLVLAAACDLIGDISSDLDLPGNLQIKGS